MIKPRSSLEEPAATSGPALGGFAGDVLKLAGGTTFSQALSTLAMPVLSRLYSPEAFGSATLFTSVVGIIGVLACLRYELAIVLPERDEEATNVFAVSLLLTLVVTSVSAAAILVARRSVLKVLNVPDLRFYGWLVPLAVLSNGVFLSLSYWNSRTKRFGRLSIAHASQSIVKNGSQLAMGLSGQANAGSLIGGIVLGSAVVTVVLGYQILREDYKLFREHIHYHGIVEMLKRYRKFPLLDSWGSLINTVSALSPALILAFFFSQTTVGYYGQAYLIVGLPVTLVGRAVTQVFFQRASETALDPKGLVRTAGTMFRSMVALGLIPVVLLAVLGRDIITLLLGPSWSDAGTYVQILAPWAFFWFIYSPFSAIFAVVERQELFLIAHIVLLFIRLASLFIGGMTGDIFLTLGLFAGLGVLAYGGLATWAIRLTGIPARSVLLTLLRYGLLCLPTAGLLMLLKLWLNVHLAVLLTVGVILSLVDYLLVLRHEPELLNYAKSLLLRKR